MPDTAATISPHQEVEQELNFNRMSFGPASPMTWLASFGQALEAGDFDAAASLFLPESLWRDLVAFTWNIITIDGKEAIGQMLKTQLPVIKPNSFKMQSINHESDGEVEATFTFETVVSRGKGTVKLHGDLVSASTAKIHNHCCYETIFSGLDNYNHARGAQGVRRESWPSTESGELRTVVSHASQHHNHKV